MNATVGRPLRFFLSYRRRAATDAALATRLREGLEAAGCEVFIDVSMPVGTDWSAEIERRILWCDYLVVLLSAEAIASEMVQGEVRRAHVRSGEIGRNLILPLRVAYEGPLGYELDSYLGKLQYALWRSTGDDERVLSEILRGALSATPEGDAPAPSPGAQPEAKADMRRLRQSLDAPGSPLAANNPFYVRRVADCQGDPNFPQLRELNFPHPVHASVCSGRTRPAFNFSFNRYEFPRMFMVTA